MTAGALAPLTGTPAVVTGLANHALRAAGALDDALAGVRRVSRVLESEHGGAVRAARTRLAAAEERMASYRDVLSATDGTLVRYAEALGTGQSAADGAVARRDEALARASAHRLEVDAHRSTWNVVLGPQASWQAATAQRNLLAARADVVAAEVDWRRARDTVADAAARAAGELRGLAQVRALRIASAGGAGAVGFTQSWVAGTDAVALLDATVAVPDPAQRTARRHELRDLLTAHGGDLAFWTSFWDEATPEQLYLALGVDLLAPSAPPDAALLAALTGGAEAWARTASPAELGAFGTAVVDDVGTWATGLPGRAELAAALLPPTLPAAVHGAAFDALVARPQDPDGIDLDATGALWIAVATGLAQHPRLAFDRLAPADPARGSLVSRRWFGVQPGAGYAGGRGTGWRDGGLAATRALRVAVATGVASEHRADQARAALLAARATLDLPVGMLAAPVSDEASVQVALALEPYVPAFAEAADQQPGTTDSIRLSEAADLPPSPVVQPRLDAFALRDVIAATSRGPRGADAWLSGTDVLRDRVADLATSGAFDTDTGPRNSLGQLYLQDAGVVAGSLQADTISTARERLAFRDATIDALGLVPIPSSGAASNVVGALAAPTTTAAPHVLADPVVLARERVLATEPELRHQLAAPLHDAVVAHDVATGVPRAEAELRAGPLDPDGAVVCDTFRGTYTDASDVRPEQGDRHCPGTG